MAIQDLRIKEETLTDRSTVFDVVFTPMVAGFERVEITFHCTTQAEAQKLLTALDDGVVGVGIETKIKEDAPIAPLRSAPSMKSMARRNKSMGRTRR